ncbi:MAG: hypothetical protein PHT30_05605 [Bacilli bacterium]|nr:hypothetical protein [Bacilli bacterium]
MKAKAKRPYEGWYVSYGLLCNKILTKYQTLAEFSEKVLELPAKEFEKVLKCQRDLNIDQLEKMIVALDLTKSPEQINRLFYTYFQIY